MREFISNSQFLVILSMAAAEFVNDELEFGRDGRFYHSFTENIRELW